MRLYSSTLTHYPASSRKLSSSDANMPAFSCYEAASAKPLFYTSTAEIVITRPGVVEPPERGTADPDDAPRRSQSPVPDAPTTSDLNDRVARYLAEVEKQNKYLHERRKFRFNVIPDGNCLYRAMSKAAYGEQSMHRELREQTLHHIADHLDEFSPIIEGDVGEFLIGAAQDGAWAGYPELLAMSQMLNVNVHLTTGGSADSPTVSTMVHCLGEEDPGRPAVWLSWLSNGHYDVLLDRRAANPEYEEWCRVAHAQRRRDEELARCMAASLSKMYIEQNGAH
uniref:OTU domain-containing protein 1 n=2 Tax=Denticeps clupeoides TaxID=299321 RepID=A0AAY4BX81_9TELE